MSDERTRLVELWRAVFGEPPPLCADSQVLTQVLVRCLPPVPPYRLGADAHAVPEPPAPPP